MKSLAALLAATLASNILVHAALINPNLEKRQVSTDGRCGTGFGTICQPNECCSSSGWCGIGYLYCSAPSCQLTYGPACDANTRPNGPNTAHIARPKLGSVPYGQAIYHCERYGDIALSYDDGPFTYTADLLDLLKKHNAKATFYLTGRNLGKGAINDPSTPWPHLIRRMIHEGHQVSSHTWSHQRLTTLSKSQFWNQIIYNEIALADILGYFPTYLRPPYSASTETTDAWLGELGYHVTYFNLDTEGYLHDSPNLIGTSKAIWDNAVEGRDPESTRYLLIEHDPVYQSVYNLTAHILSSLSRNNFRTVTVGECLNDPEENWYRSVTSPPPSEEDTESFPPTQDGRCGFGHSDQTCAFEPIDKCCSQRGWCGSTEDHCGRGCQPVFGNCLDVAPPGAMSTIREEEVSACEVEVPTTLPVSEDGRCGPHNGGRTCLGVEGGTCCSQYGWCGATGEHCGEGCQVGFGTCGSSHE